MNTATIRRDWVGRVVDGRFPLTQWLGGSDRSGVFLTELRGQGSRKAAIKLIPADYPYAEKRIAGWRATENLSHPHLTRVFHTGSSQIDTTGLVYAVTEYAEEVLAEIIQERPLTPRETNDMLSPVLDALFYLHGKGFVHGHLKPSNILASGNRVKISGDSIEVAGQPVQHFRVLSVYDAPEISSEKITPAADIWSVGATVVEVMTQHPPDWDRTINKAPVVTESIPQPFAGLARECLRLDPARRYSLADVNKARLLPAGTVPGAPTRTEEAEPDEAGMSKARGTRLGVMALIAVALVLVAVIAVMRLRSRPTKPSPPPAQQQAVPAPAPAPEPAKAAEPPKAEMSHGAKVPAPVPTTARVRPTAPVEAPVQAPAAPTQPLNGAVVKGAVTNRVLPDVSESASRTIEGTVRVRVRVAVDPSGDVSDATFDSPGPSKYFSRLAMQAAKGWKFTPAQVDGKAVASVWTLEFLFQRDGTDVVSTEVSP